MKKKKVTHPPKKIEYKDYADYLKSDKWKQVKTNYYANEQTSNCLRCSVSLKSSNISTHYHHFQYPKDWNNDSWENLIIVCEDCHKNLHSEIDWNDGVMPSLRSLMMSFSIVRMGQGSRMRESCIAVAIYESVNVWLNTDGSTGGILIGSTKIIAPSLADAVKKEQSSSSQDQ